MTSRPVSPARPNSVGVLLLHTFTSTSFMHSCCPSRTRRLYCARARLREGCRLTPTRHAAKSLEILGHASWAGLTDQIRSASLFFESRTFSRVVYPRLDRRR